MTNPVSMPLATLRNLLLVLGACLPVQAAAQHAHQHGAARMGLAVDGEKLLISLDSPLDNLAGFEQAPRTEQQRAALQRMEETLRAGERLFKLPPAAECKAVGAAVSHPHQAAGHTKKAGGAARKAHADVQASWEFVCARPAALDRVEVHLFDAFRGIERISVQSVTAKGQGGATLTPARRTLSL